ncbi:MAG: branched-chain amino acid ABC transporter permease [Chloroflexi bacterium]|nr:branched-chain amino acid ABC transporter permease [Chloroflexota bacterium]
MNSFLKLEQQRTAAKGSVWQILVAALGRVGITPLGLGLLVIIAILPNVPPFNQEHIVRWLIAGAFLGAQAVAFDFTAGFINVVNFGFAAMLGLGAYTSALLANTAPYLVLRLGISPWIGIWVGALVAGLVGLLLGMLTLRLRGIYAAVMAWFVGIALMGLANNLTTLTRGSMGLHPQTLLTTTDNLPYFYIILGMLIFIYVTLNLVTKSTIGLAFKAIGQNIDAARASGINPTKYRVFNFALSCTFAGLLGGFYAHFYGSLTPQNLMHTSKTVEVLAIAYIGGRGTLWGGVAFAFPFVILMEYLRSNLTNLPGLQLVIYGVLMMLVMIYYPAGLSGLYYWAEAKVRTALFRRRMPSPDEKA